jgi:hypothetical protein
MPLTTLDTTTALIVIDLQKVMLGLPIVHPVGEVFNYSRAIDLLDSTAEKASD